MTVLGRIPKFGYPAYFCGKILDIGDISLIQAENLQLLKLQIDPID